MYYTHNDLIPRMVLSAPMQSELFMHILLFSALSHGYRPVIIMHGILLSYKNMEDLVALIEEAHPGTEIHNVDAYNYFVSVPKVQYTHMQKFFVDWDT